MDLGLEQDYIVCPLYVGMHQERITHAGRVPDRVLKDFVKGPAEIVELLGVRLLQMGNHVDQQANIKGTTFRRSMFPLSSEWFLHDSPSFRRRCPWLPVHFAWVFQLGTAGPQV